VGVAIVGGLALVAGVVGSLVVKGARTTRPSLATLSSMSDPRLAAWRFAGSFSKSKSLYRSPQTSRLPALGHSLTIKSPRRAWWALRLWVAWL
jgi:hypothetical protein